MAILSLEALKNRSSRGRILGKVWASSSAAVGRKGRHLRRPCRWHGRCRLRSCMWMRRSGHSGCAADRSWRAIARARLTVGGVWRIHPALARPATGTT
jgi:hypothetical protein